MEFLPSYSSSTMLFSPRETLALYIKPFHQSTSTNKLRYTEQTRSHFPFLFPSSPPSDSTPPCPSDILRCHAKQKTATASRISCPDTPKHHTPSSRSHSKPSALVHKHEVIRKSTSKHHTTHKLNILHTHSENIEKHVQHSHPQSTYQIFDHTSPWKPP